MFIVDSGRNSVGYDTEISCVREIALFVCPTGAEHALHHHPSSLLTVEYNQGQLQPYEQGAKIVGNTHGRTGLRSSAAVLTVSEWVG